MHELSIAAAIADVARRHAGGRRVARVELKVGHLRQVVPRALTFAWELVGRDMVLEGSELLIEEMPARGRCRACGATGPLPGFPLACSACGGFDLEVVAGEELLVEALELDDEPAEPFSKAVGTAEVNVIHRENWPTRTGKAREAI